MYFLDFLHGIVQNSIQYPIHFLTLLRMIFLETLTVVVILKLLENQVEDNGNLLST